MTNHSSAFDTKKLGIHVGRKSKQLGSLNVHTSKKGDTYMSGVLNIDGETIHVLVFKNSRMTADDPQWSIVRNTNYKPYKKVTAKGLMSQMNNNLLTYQKEDTSKDIFPDKPPF